MNPLIVILVPILKKQALKLAKGIATSDQPDVGEWRGKYRLEPNGERMFMFIQDREDPLRFFHFESDLEFMPGHPESPFHTDLGSIPWIAEKAIPRDVARLRPDDFPEAYGGHDFPYKYGFIWVRKPGGAWTRVPVDRRESDVMLFWFLSAHSPTTGLEPTRVEAQSVYRAVRACAAPAWNKHRRGEVTDLRAIS